MWEIDLPTQLHAYAHSEADDEDSEESRLSDYEEAVRILNAQRAKEGIDSLGECSKLVCNCLCGFTEVKQSDFMGMRTTWVGVLGWMQTCVLSPPGR